MRIIQLWFRPMQALFVAGVVLLLASRVRAQSDLENVLKQYNAATVDGYIKPMVDLFGANMNAGLFHSAAIPTTGLKIEIDIVGMGSVVGDERKTYSAPAPPGFGVSTFKTATLFGGKGGKITASDGRSYGGSDGIIDATLFPLAVPQLTIGSIFGTEVAVRFVTSPTLKDAFPKTTLFGAGARHSISQYIPAPLDLSVGFFYSSFTVGDIIDFKGLSVGAQASKSFAVFTLYGGLAWEKSKMNLKYTSSLVSGSKVDLDLDGENNSRVTVGGGLSLGIFKLFADANFGSITNYSGGIGFGF